MKPIDFGIEHDEWIGGDTERRIYITICTEDGVSMNECEVREYEKNGKRLFGILYEQTIIGNPYTHDKAINEEYYDWFPNLQDALKSLSKENKNLMHSIQNKLNDCIKSQKSIDAMLGEK